MRPGYYQYTATVDNLTLLADTGDFLLLAGGANPWWLIEAKIFQRGSTTLTQEVIRFHRGTAGSGGGALTEHEWAIDGPTSLTLATSLPTMDVGTDDWVYHEGWNILQQAIVLPIPEMQLPFQGSDDLGIAQMTGIAHTGVGVTVTWQEVVV